MVQGMLGLDTESNGEIQKGSCWGMACSDYVQRPGEVQREMDVLAM